MQLVYPRPVFIELSNKAACCKESYETTWPEAASATHLNVRPRPPFYAASRPRQSFQSGEPGASTISPTRSHRDRRRQISEEVSFPGATAAPGDERLAF